MNKKISRPDPQELDKLMEELERRRADSDQRSPGSEYLNPWNFGKKNIRGKTIISAKLPDKLPE